MEHISQVLLLVCIILTMSNISSNALFYDCNSLNNGSLLTQVDSDVQCESFKDKSHPIRCYNASTHRVYIFDLLKEWYEEKNTTKFCVSLNQISVSEINNFKIAQEYTIGFELSIPVGIIETNGSSTISKWTLRAVYILSDIANLMMFRSAPDSTSFWNFSSPYLNWEQNWLQNIHIRGYVFKWEYICSLNNTSVNDLTFIWYQLPQVLPNEKGRNLMFPCTVSLPYLTSITIQNNSLNNITNFNFGGFPNLRNLILSRNNLSDTPQSLSALENLVMLDLSQNRKISFSKNSTFSKILPTLKHLKKLCLTGTFLGNISVPFPNLTKLHDVYLSKCSIESIVDDAFNNTPSIITLDLSHNSLKYIRLSFPKKLKILLLNYNKIHHLEAYSGGVQVVESFSLSFNNFSSWPRLSGMNFHHFDISNNPLSDVVHYEDVAVSWLKIRHTLITNWSSPTSFSWVTYTLNISSNHIQVFTENMKKSVTHLTKIDLSQNPFDCSDCRIEILKDLLQMNAPRQMRVPRCGSPENQRGHPVREALCVPAPTNYLLLIAVPVGVAGALFVLVIAILLVWRSEISYSMRLYKMRSDEKNKHSEAFYDAFVCYGSKERKFVLRELAPLLEKGSERYRLCLHDWDFLQNSNRTRKRLEAIDHCRRVIVVLSPHFINTKWNLWEQEMAKHRVFKRSRKFLVLLERERLHETVLPRYLRELEQTARPTQLMWLRDADTVAKEDIVYHLKESLGRSIHQRKMDLNSRGRISMPIPEEGLPEHGGPSQQPDERTPLIAGVGNHL